MATSHYTNTTSTVVEVSFYIGAGAFVESGQKLTFNDWEAGHMFVREPGSRKIIRSGKVREIAEPGD